MAKTNFKRKTRSDKFPLTLHKTGRYCKKITGKLYDFGTDRVKALHRYLEDATFLHTGCSHILPVEEELCWYGCSRTSQAKAA